MPFPTQEEGGIKCRRDFKEILKKYSQGALSPQHTLTHKKRITAKGFVYAKLTFLFFF